ncbi:para-aminobenzoate synthetase component 1 [Gelidibacter sediminis]|uniref:Para-aminobenzoate synthetase component 1 n=1 Tax=Gelidibacter sediminis TaxID=1608710 RepID=A0A4R7PY09_9FLAO|nr:anthranilate synthase component I family protein [Gelidibacter sediminis]TDU39863.1 para-aminobenzoate synthetase component 1 [Gelidibacter sediminis]
MRTRHTFTIANPDFKAQLLQWSQQFEEVVWLDSNRYQQNYSTYDAVLAVDAFTCISTDSHQGFDQLQEYQAITKDWIFGYLTYDLKNDLENLKSEHFDGLEFPDLFFFQPKKIFLIKGDIVEMDYLRMVDDEFESDLKEIAAIDFDEPTKPSKLLNIQMRLTKEQYVAKVNTMLDHIHRGDIYEANFCHEFYAEKTHIDALATYRKLNAISKAPFAAYFRNHDHYLLSASPERYLKKIGNKVISQPIKGTASRSKDQLADENLKNELENNPKERSENIMIVDLVRNDLSHTAKKGSVTVEELCAIYTFEQVHQMISTITSEVEATIPPVHILKTTFPMGSMTGAPKISAMQIIEDLEETKRGLYSGSIGYFTPSGDFDFNVVIRSILYNADNNYVSYSVGSAITSKSDPLKEYEECLIKAKAMKEVLEN